MIEIQFKIKESKGRVSITGSGGGFPTKLEYEFTEEFLKHMNSFNTKFESCRTHNPITMRFKTS